MACKPDRAYRLRWSGGWFRGPVWPPERQPDIDVIRTLAKKHLQELAKGPLNDTSLEVSFFAEGAYNKLFLIAAPELGSSYLLRATLPVEPYFKTESELEGVTVYDTWRKMPWDRKLILVEEVAKLTKELHSHTFDKIGSLYFKSALDDLADGRDRLVTATSNQNDERNDSDHHVILTGMSKEVGLEKQHERPEIATEIVTSQAQAFSSAYDQVSAAHPPVSPENPGADEHITKASSEKTSFQLQWIKRGPVEDDDEFGDDFEEEVPKMKRYCNEYLDVLPRVFANEEAELPYTLHHHDLNASNIIVDPETFKIIGIVDWEMVNIVPLWRAASYPRFLDYARRWTGEVNTPPHLESVKSYRENQVDCIEEKRDRWDYQILRDHWDATMKQLKKHDEVLLDPSEVETKNEYSHEITNLTDMWNWARIWLYRFENGTKGLPPGGGDDEDWPSRKRESKEDLSEGLVSSREVLVKEEAEDEGAVTNGVASPVSIT
ncbi:MAG: hypothetical protein Q9195_007851 [Heterodermia aff. obscurata]